MRPIWQQCRPEVEDTYYPGDREHRARIAEALREATPAAIAYELRSIAMILDADDEAHHREAQAAYPVLQAIADRIEQGGTTP